MQFRVRFGVVRLWIIVYQPDTTMQIRASKRQSIPARSCGLPTPIRTLAQSLLPKTVSMSRNPLWPPSRGWMWRQMVLWSRGCGMLDRKSDREGEVSAVELDGWMDMLITDPTGVLPCEPRSFNLTSPQSRATSSARTRMSAAESLKCFIIARRGFPLLLMYVVGFNNPTFLVPTRMAP